MDFAGLSKTAKDQSWRRVCPQTIVAHQCDPPNDSSLLAILPAINRLLWLIRGKLVSSEASVLHFVIPCALAKMTPEDLKELPLRLNTPVLADAIFEVRFRGKLGIADLLPGTLAAGLQDHGEPLVTRLGAADLPPQIRMTQPELIYAPLVQLRWPEFMINVGDRSISILCTLPYVGWAKFRQNILTVLGLLAPMRFVEVVEQFGFKYIDMLSDRIFPDDMKRIDWDFQLGQQPLDVSKSAIKTEWVEGDTTVSVEIASTLSMVVNGEQKGRGFYVGTEAVNMLKAPIDWATFMGTLSAELDGLHLTAKKTFFRCLTTEALAVLGPVYEEKKNA